MSRRGSGLSVRVLRAQSVARLVVLGLLVKITACGPESSVRVGKQAMPPGPIASKRVDAMGGTLELTAGPARGAKIVIPPGALSKPVTITIRAEGEFAKDLPAGLVSTGPVVVLGPEGQKFARPVSITLPTPKAGHQIFTRPQRGGIWTQVPHARFLPPDSVTADVTHFSVFVSVKSDTSRIELGTMISETWGATGGKFMLKDKYGRPMSHAHIVQVPEPSGQPHFYAVYQTTTWGLSARTRDEAGKDDRYR